MLYYIGFAADTYITLTMWPRLMTFDLEHLQHIACNVMKLCTQQSNPRPSYCDFSV